MKPKSRLLSTTVFGVTVMVGYAADSYTPEQLAAMPYREYLQTPEWRERRRRALIKAGHRCEECGRRNALFHVHHLTYERRGYEHPDDLVVLCEDCHHTIHGIDR